MRPHMPPRVPDPDDERKREEAYRKARAAYDEQVRRGVRPAGRKPLPPHIVKQILDAGVGRRQWVDPVRLEMEARRRATKPERDKARAARRAKKADKKDEDG